MVFSLTSPEKRAETEPLVYISVTSSSEYVATKSFTNFYYCLSISFQCIDTEFGCKDGVCLPDVSRCNEVFDCSGKFDEKNCNMVVIDKDIYRKEFPPFQGHGNKTTVSINVTINALGSIQETGMTFIANFLIELEW